MLEILFLISMLPKCSEDELCPVLTTVFRIILILWCIKHTLHKSLEFGWWVSWKWYILVMCSLWLDRVPSLNLFYHWFFFNYFYSDFCLILKIVWRMNLEFLAFALLNAQSCFCMLFHCSYFSQIFIYVWWYKWHSILIAEWELKSWFQIVFLDGSSYFVPW